MNSQDLELSHRLRSDLKLGDSKEKQKCGHKKAPDRPDQFITEMALSGAFYIEFNYFASCCKLESKYLSCLCRCCHLVSCNPYYVSRSCN